MNVITSKIWFIAFNVCREQDIIILIDYKRNMKLENEKENWIHKVLVQEENAFSQKGIC